MLPIILILVACSGHVEKRSNLQPGESLFELLDDAAVVTYPSTNLPPDVVSLLRRPFRFRSRVLLSDEWDWIDNSTIPLWITRVNARHPGLTYRAASSPIPHSLMQDSVRVYVHGEECRPWRMDSSDFPGEHIWWDRKHRILCSLSPLSPEGVSIESRGIPGENIEPTGLFSFPTAHGERTPKPAPDELVTNAEMSYVSRHCIMLPAPGVISFPIKRLCCDELRVAVGVVDQCYRIGGTTLEQSRGRCDGVSLLVRVVAEGQPSTVWQRDISPDELGVWLPEVSIDLSNHLGETIKLELVTEPGANGNADYDYAVWGGLRLYGNPATRPDEPHLILIDIDTLRKDRLGCYGYQRRTSPRLDRWAEERAVIYSNCQATAPWTLPSTVSIFTGLAVDQHRVDRFPDSMEMRLPSLAHFLRNSGYETFGLAEGAYVAASHGLDLGFDYYDCTRYNDPDWRQALSWIRSRRSERPFFLFCHTYLVHAPFPHDTRFQDPDEPYVGRWAGEDIDYQNVITPFVTGTLSLTAKDKLYINSLYDAGVFQMDTTVGGFIDSLGLLLGDEPYAVLFTSDHGEEFFEHGKMGHGHSLYRELLDVPLVIQFPRRDNGWERGVVEVPVSTLDIMPTILDLAGIQIPHECSGRSLLRARPETAIRIARQSSKIHSITVGGHKLILDATPKRSAAPPSAKLYDLTRDPNEVENLALSQAERVKELAHLLKNRLQDSPVPDASDAVRVVDTRTSNRLRALGYLQ
jgi:arylsulfatase A-like enzyme